MLGRVRHGNIMCRQNGEEAKSEEYLLRRYLFLFERLLHVVPVFPRVDQVLHLVDGQYVVFEIVNDLQQLVLGRG